MCAKIDHFVYSVYENTSIAKYNLFNKRTSIVFRSNNVIHAYHITNSNIIAYMYNHQIYWNGVLLNVPYLFDGKAYEYIKINDGDYIALCYSNILLNNKNDQIYCPMPYFVSSTNGQMIVYCKYCEKDRYVRIYKQNIRQTSKEGLFDHNSEDIGIEGYAILDWIPNSNCVLLADQIILNLDSNRQMRTITPIFDFFVFFVNGLILIWHYGFVEIQSVRKKITLFKNCYDLMYYLMQVSSCIHYINTRRLQYFYKKLIKKYLNIICYMYNMRAIKTSLNKIADPTLTEKINLIVDITNRLVINVYQFIKLYILEQYECHRQIPIIDDNFILCCFGTISYKTNKRGKEITVNKELMQNLNMFYESNFKALHEGKIEIKNMSQILRYQASNIITNIQNNVFLNFQKYLKNLMIMWCKKYDITLNRRIINNYAIKIMQGVNFESMIKELYDKTNKLSIMMEDIYSQIKNAINDYYEDILLQIEDDYIFKVVYYKELKQTMIQNNTMNEKYKAKLNRKIKEKFLNALHYRNLKREYKQTKNQLQMQIHTTHERYKVLLNRIERDKILDVQKYWDLFNKYECLDQLNTDNFHKLEKIANEINSNHLQITYCTMADIIIKHYLPKITDDKPIAYHLKASFHKYLFYMIKINREIERYNKKLPVEKRHQMQKLYQVLPQRTNVVPKYIAIDTLTVRKIFIPKGKTQLYKETINDESKKKTWKLGFSKLYEKKNKKLLECGEYRFNNIIYTDGYAVSVIQTRKGAEKRDPNYKIKRAKVRKKKFENIDELSKKKLKELKNYELVGIDPGKRNILTMINYAEESKDRKKLIYTSQQRQVECLHKYTEKIFERRKTHKVQEQEELISNNNCKSSYVKSFSKYIRVKNEANKKELLKHYSTDIFRKYKWKTYIHMQKSEAKLVNNIKKTYGTEKEICLVYGNWSQSKQIANHYSTPNIGTIKMLGHNFKVLLVDEYKTSKLCCNCNSENEKFMVRKNPRPYKTDNITLNSLLRCKNVKCNKFYDRDVNGASNILNLALHHIKSNERKDKFRRKSNIQSLL